MLDKPGEVHIEVRGSDLTQLTNESGIHTLQRVPPTERYGRVHTSTVTVAIVDPSEVLTNAVAEIPSRDLDISWYSGTGKGGQNRNKVQACCRLTHIPTNTVKTAQCRTRETSYSQAYAAMVVALNELSKNNAISSLSATRQTQISSKSGSGKVRTYRFKDNIAIDHRHNKKANLTKVLDGNFNLLW